MFDNPVGVAVDDQGNVLIADSYNSRIQWFSSEGQFLRQAPVSCWGGQGHLEPYLEIDSKGRIWTTDSRNNTVLVLDRDGNEIKSIDSNRFSRANAHRGANES